MNISYIFLEDTLQPDLRKLRWVMVIGGILIGLFMIADLALLPSSLHPIYLIDRLCLQLPAVLLLLLFTFHRRFPSYYQVALAASILVLTYANYGLIYLCWRQSQIAFPYEGTLLYAFFGFFVLGMSFRFAVVYCILVSAGFALLVFNFPIYGEHTQVVFGFVVASLFIGTIAIYRLDDLFARIHEANAQLQQMSATDPLTNLFNRRALIEESEQLFNLSRRSGKSIAVFMVDMDHFKEFNDTYGHLAGDKAIITQAEILRAVFRRQTDVLGRYGGEEFLAVTLDSGEEDCDEQASEILRHWQEKQIPCAISGTEGFLSCSIGICHAIPGREWRLEDMIRCADESLYRAKREGRGRFVRAPIQAEAVPANPV
ncbi:GGDEF domain-containing protein [Mangrovitalea sediminis]|uniref:GGDEF domain-containing protein n=1 Tax=Mangrovitalea sediminis TaxID=1982043 RepID=UPI0011779ED7|nr:GGDEF domain-containing protein [Mangrovitalea sediminis]